MDLLEKLGHYVASLGYSTGTPAKAPSSDGGVPFITISREAGAGGHTLVNALLDEMAKTNVPLFSGWQVFDAAFCARLLEDAKLQASLESLHREETRSAWGDAIYELVGGRASSDKIYRRTFQAMKLLAQMGKVIIIGRGGACATADLPLGIHVRLVAPPSLRIERMKQQLQISSTHAPRIVGEYDVERARFVGAHFGKDIGDPFFYHAIWNTGRVPLDEIAHHLLEMVKVRTLNPVLA